MPVTYEKVKQEEQIENKKRNEEIRKNTEIANLKIKKDTEKLLNKLTTNDGVKEDLDRILTNFVRKNTNGGTFDCYFTKIRYHKFEISIEQLNDCFRNIIDEWKQFDWNIKIKKMKKERIHLEWERNNEMIGIIYVNNVYCTLATNFYETTLIVTFEITPIVKKHQ